VRVRMALQELGPTFVKLGQVLATRVDLFPPEWVVEFEKLHSDVPPVPFEELLPELTNALGRSPFDVFVDLVRTPDGSASIAQVHRAKLPGGEDVVLKIRRPGIRPKVEADLRLLAHLAALVESEMPEARRYQPVEIAVQFSRSLERELDFTVEAMNIERFAKHLADDPYIVIPKVHTEYTSETLLVQEHVSGIPGTDVRKLAHRRLIVRQDDRTVACPPLEDAIARDRRRECRRRQHRRGGRGENEKAMHRSLPLFGEPAISADPWSPANGRHPRQLSAGCNRPISAKLHTVTARYKARMSCIPSQESRRRPGGRGGHA